MTKKGERYDFGPGRMDKSFPPDTAFFEIDNYELFAWSPDPEPGRTPPTQVHLHWELKGLPDIKQVLRFKGPVGMDQLIDLLIEYREAVWGQRPTPRQRGEEA
jgi:hypothetical protein